MSLMGKVNFIDIKYWHFIYLIKIIYCYAACPLFLLEKLMFVEGPNRYKYVVFITISYVVQQTVYSIEFERNTLRY